MGNHMYAQTDGEANNANADDQAVIRAGGKNIEDFLGCGHENSGRDDARSKRVSPIRNQLKVLVAALLIGQLLTSSDILEHAHCSRSICG